MATHRLAACCACSPAHAVLSDKLGEAVCQALGEAWHRLHLDLNGFKGAQRDVCKELGRR